MGFLQSVIAEARSTVSEPTASGGTSSVAVVGSGLLDAPFEGAVGNGRSVHSSHGEVDSGIEAPVSHHPDPSILSSQAKKADQVSQRDGRHADRDVPINRIGNDMAGETVDETISQESGFQTLEEVHIYSETPAEVIASEMKQAKVQTPVTGEAPLPPALVEAPLSDGQENTPPRDAYSPLTLGEKKTDQPSHVLEEVTGMAKSSPLTSALPEQSVQPVADDLEISRLANPPVSENTDSRLLANELRDRVIKPPPVIAAESDAEHITRPEKQLPLAVDPEPEVSETIITAQAERPVTESVVGNRAVQKPIFLRPQKVAAADNNDDGSPSDTQYLKTVLRQQVMDLSAREKAVVGQQDGIAHQPVQPVYQNTGRADSPAAGIPQQVHREPEVRIGQVDVFIEGPQRPSDPAGPSPRPTLSLASRHYLRRI